jgi:phage terminase large subunit-like protein
MMLDLDAFVEDVLIDVGAIEPEPVVVDIPPAVDWIQSNFYIPETNAAIQLEPYQQAVLGEALKTTKGLFDYSFILWSDLKKSAKSTIAGAISLYLAWHHAWETVRVVANDLKQADSRTFFYIERAIRLNPAWAGLCKINNYEITLPNHTTIHAIPVDPKGEAGGGDLVTTFTEMWAMKSKAAQTLWSETTLSPLKFGKSIRIGESYAGYKGDSPVLEPLYETGIRGEHLNLSFTDKEGKFHDLSDLEVYRNGRMLMMWNTRPRCDWQSKAYYEQEASVLTPDEFRRIHRNEWVDATETFVPAEWWAACGRETYAAVGHDEPCILALDAGISSDCFAVVMVTRRDDKIQVQYARKWQPQHGQKLDFEPIRLEIVRLIHEHNVIELCYDPYQLHDFCTRLRNEEYVNAREFNQAAPRAIADKRLFDMIREKRVQHKNEPDLNEHIINAHRKPEEDNKLRIIKGQDTKKKVDLAVALSMGTDRAFAYAMD